MFRVPLFLFDQIVPFGKWVRIGIAKGAAWIGRNPLLAALIATLCLSGWLWHSRDEALAKLAAIQAAQKTAAQDQAAVNHEPARKSGEIARKSDEDAPAYYEAGRSAADAYANAHRMREAACPVSDAHLPRAGGAEQSDDRSDQAPGMVALSRDDFDLLTGNSLRLAKVHQDAQALIAQGVAVPSATLVPE